MSTHPDTKPVRARCASCSAEVSLPQIDCPCCGSPLALSPDVLAWALATIGRYRARKVALGEACP